MNNIIIVSGERGRDSVTHIHVSVHHRASSLSVLLFLAVSRMRGSAVQEIWAGPDETKIDGACTTGILRL